MAPPSAHLLRTLAAVAPGSRVLDAACGGGRHLDPLARLGFDVWAATAAAPDPARERLAAVLGETADDRVRHAPPDALPFPDAWADWVVLSGPGQLAESLAEARRVLRPGGWVWTEIADSDDGRATLTASARRAGLALAEAPAIDDGSLHAIFRRPGDVG